MKNVYMFLKILIYKFKILKKVCNFFFKLIKNIVKMRIKIVFMKELFLYILWIYVMKLKYKDWYSIMENLSYFNIWNIIIMVKKINKLEVDFYFIYKYL